MNPIITFEVINTSTGIYAKRLTVALHVRLTSDWSQIAKLMWFQPELSAFE